MNTATPAGAPTAERGGIVIGWLVRLIVVLVIVALAVFEAGAIILAHVQSDTAATDASDEAALAYARTHDRDQARDAAAAKAKSEGATLTGFSVDASGKSVTVTVEKDARTLFLQHVSFSRKWGEARTTRTQSVPD